MNNTAPYLTSFEISRQGFCVGCGACTEICPYKTISNGKAVSFFNCSNEMAKCDLYCPKTPTDKNRVHKRIFSKDYNDFKSGQIFKIYRAKAGKKFSRIFEEKKTISAISIFLLEKKRIDKILMNKTDESFLSKAFFAETRTDIIQNASTNYCTNSSLSFMHTKKADNYAFVGTPCQITSIAKMRASDPACSPSYLPVLAIGLFCSWGLEPLEFSSYVRNLLKDEKIINSYITSGRNQKVIFQLKNNTTIKKDLREIKKFIRKGCTICSDLTSEFSDISVGDYEPDSRYNALIIRTEKAWEIIKQAEKSDYIQLSEFPENDLEDLKKASISKKRKAQLNSLKYFGKREEMAANQ